MRLSLPALGLIAITFPSNAAEAPGEWKLLLETPLVDEWQPIFGAALTQPARPAETWAQKFAEFQRAIAKSTGGKRVPIYLSPELAATLLPAVPEQNRIGLPLLRVPLAEVLNYIANLSNVQMRITDAGVLLDLPVTPQPNSR